MIICHSNGAWCPPNQAAYCFTRFHAGVDIMILYVYHSLSPKLKRMHKKDLKIIFPGNISVSWICTVCTRLMTDLHRFPPRLKRYFPVFLTSRSCARFSTIIAVSPARAIWPRLISTNRMSTASPREKMLGSSTCLSYPFPQIELLKCPSDASNGS